MRISGIISQRERRTRKGAPHTGSKHVAYTGNDYYRSANSDFAHQMAYRMSPGNWAILVTDMMIALIGGMVVAHFWITP